MYASHFPDQIRRLNRDDCSAKKLFKIVALLVSSVYVIPLEISIGIDCILFCPNVALVNFQYILFFESGLSIFL